MYLLAGLKFDREVAKVLLSGVKRMKESTTYQAILEEGQKEGEKKHAIRTLRTLGTRRFGKPPAKIARKLQSYEVV